jgi:ATP-binding cassette subfamily F protein 3
MLQLTEVSLRRGGRLLFANATFQVHAGQRLGLTGANGSGKSSLFAGILGELDRTKASSLWTPARIAHVAQKPLVDGAGSGWRYRARRAGRLKPAKMNPRSTTTPGN